MAGRILIEGEDSTIVLLPDEDGTVGQILVTTAAGEQLFLDQPFQATVFAGATMLTGESCR